MQPIVTTKICTKCKLTLSISNFYPSKHRTSGYLARCKPCTLEDNKKYYDTEKNTKQCRKWMQNNRERSRQLQRQYSKRNLNCRIRSALRNRLYYAAAGRMTDVSAIRHLGCTILELRLHIESKFQPGMSWDNWTTNGWHIDHIRPLSSFDLSDPEQIKQAVHYTNLQPLWAKENQSKGSKWKN